MFLEIEAFKQDDLTIVFVGESANTLLFFILNRNCQIPQIYFTFFKIMSLLIINKESSAIPHPIKILSFFAI